VFDKRRPRTRSWSGPFLRLDREDRARYALEENLGGPKGLPASLRGRYEAAE
jgi:hypothetical protein